MNKKLKRNALMRGVTVVQRGWMADLAIDEEIYELLGVWEYLHAHDGGLSGVGGTQTEWLMKSHEDGHLRVVTWLYQPDCRGPVFSVETEVSADYTGPKEAEGEWLAMAQQCAWPVIQSPRRLDYRLLPAPQVGPDWTLIDVQYNHGEEVWNGGYTAPHPSWWRVRSFEEALKAALS